MCPAVNETPDLPPDVALWELADFSAPTLLKARKALQDDKVARDVAVRSIWSVGGSVPGTRYRVQSDVDEVTLRGSWITCTCPHGLNTGGRAHCYHAAAVVILIAAQARLAQMEVDEA